MLPRQLAAEALAVDQDLMARVRARDPEALRALYDRHVGLVHGLGCRILPEPSEAEDLVEDVFLHVWRRADLFDGRRESFLGWLVSVTRNRAIDRLRVRRARPPGTGAREAAGAIHVAPPAADPNESAYAAELRQAVARALGTLPAAQRAALELAYFGGISHEEIAARLESPPATVKARIRQGMLRLRELLGDGLDPGTGEATEDERR